MKRKEFLALITVCTMLFGMVGCRGDISAKAIDTELNVQITTGSEKPNEITEISDAELLQNEEMSDISEKDNENDRIYHLKKQLSSLDAFLEEYKINHSITYGVIDYNNDNINEFFAVFSQGNQGYNEMVFYSIDDEYNVNKLFSSSGFSRDGKTYFMYDNDLSRCLIVSDYTHSYFLRNEKTEAVSKDGKVSMLFESIWKADSPEEELKQTNTYINSLEVPIDEYNDEYALFIEKEYLNIIYIYDGKLFSGSDLISDGEYVYQDYLLRSEDSF